MEVVRGKIEKKKANDMEMRNVKYEMRNAKCKMRNAKKKCMKTSSLNNVSSKRKFYILIRLGSNKKKGGIFN